MELRALRADDDLAARLDLPERAFGGKNASERKTLHQAQRADGASGPVPPPPDGAIGTVHGTPLAPSACWTRGVSGAKIAPEDRGRGIATPYLLDAF